MTTTLIQQRIQNKICTQMDIGNRDLSDVYYNLFFEVQDLLRERPLTIGLDAAFATRLQTALTTDQNEDLAFICGPSVEGIQMTASFLKCHETNRTVGSASLDAASTSRAFVKIRDEGYNCFLVGHSHPGFGIGSTLPSKTDMDWIGDLQEGGAQVVGVIVNRDGYFRFFTKSVPFNVITYGRRIKQEEEHVFKLQS
ncbi:hypothetical protein G0Q06_12855 [Puniceicoccales bacterium CK1056]|uniref:JAB domain-containing protein n=1 Tax=Oceanipulchritudo coccoides TaxID=2706888 RepID=A0A6B2M5E6_9BACT|nr:hypothetical protein [Oceanipulchritudo coccoides]NDV63347.1 hypothetical protein [Oceanipulchritudo coccoides]